MENDEEESAQRQFEKMYAENDPALRVDVRAELKARGVSRINPLLLEVSLKYGARDYRYTPWFQKRGRLHLRVVRALESMQEVEPKYWAGAVQTLVRPVVWCNGFTSGRWRHIEHYSNPSPWILEHQPEPQEFLDMLQQGEDPRMVLLTMANIWLPRDRFIECANALGHDVLMWDDARNLEWQEQQQKTPENLNLCEDIQVNAAGLVAVEPFTTDKEDASEYDIYGTTIAEVTSYSIHFVPKAGVEPRDLQTHVNAAIHAFLTAKDFTFSEPTSAFKNPYNAYKRPKTPIQMLDRYTTVAEHFASQWRWTQDDQVRNQVEERLAALGVEELAKKELLYSYRGNTDLAVKLWCATGALPEGTPQVFLDFLAEQQAKLSQGYYTTVNAEGHVVLTNTLILDDVLGLYKHCGTFLMPCAAVANALNAARFAEECGPIKNAGDLSNNAGYASDNMDLTTQLGNLDGVAPEDLVDRALRDTLALLGTGHSTLQIAFMQVATIAQGTLTGLLPDGTGKYPTIAQITDGTKAGQAVAPMDTLLADRTRDMMERASAQFIAGDPATPLKDRFEAAAQAVAGLHNRAKLVKDICDYYEFDKRMREYEAQHNLASLLDKAEVRKDEPESSRVLRVERENALEAIREGRNYVPMKDAEYVLSLLAGRTEEERKNPLPYDTPPPKELDTLGRYMWWRAMDQYELNEGKPAPESERRRITARANIARFGGENGVQLPRGFEGTGYVTRGRGTPFARPGTELAPELEAFVTPDTPNETGSARLALPDPNVVFAPRPKV